MSTLEPIAVRADPPAVLDLPPAHLELTWRPLQTTDVDALFDLIQTIEDADRTPQRETRDEIVELFEGSWKDMHRDSLGGFDETGTLRAYAVVEVKPGDERTVRAFLRGGVHPQWRGRGLGRALLSWMEGRGRQKLAESGKDVPGRLATYIEERARDQRRLYAAAGFSPVRWYTDMRRDLSLPLPEVTLSDDVRIVDWTPDLDDAVRRAHNEAFADHWGSEPHTPESWRHDPHMVPEWSFVALAGDAVAGYAISGRYEPDWEPLGYTCGYTGLLGVRRAWRGRGVAAALLRATMEAYRRDGMQYACLGVDTANPTGAHGLYARLGYEATHGQVLYSVEL